MDARWQPHLDHQPAADPPGREAHELFAEGWLASSSECWLRHARSGCERLVAPSIWRALRELPACVPVQLREQARP